MDGQRGVIRAAGVTDVGLKRKVNQDNFHVDQERQLYIVADGMGGHKAGDLASRVAVDEILSYLQSEAEEERTPTGFETDEIKRQITSIELAVQTANRKICAMAREDRDRLGMGTTVVLVRSINNMFIVAHVGDSRLYRLRHGQLEVMTKDHSRVQELIDMEKLTEAEAERYPGRNVITRALGGDPELKVDLAVHELESTDILMLCTDGLSGCVPAEVIRETLLQWAGSPELSCKHLIDSAKRHGAPDNVTVVVLEASDVAAPEDATLPFTAFLPDVDQAQISAPAASMESAPAMSPPVASANFDASGIINTSRLPANTTDPPVSPEPMVENPAASGSSRLKRIFRRLRGQS